VYLGIKDYISNKGVLKKSQSGFTIIELAIVMVIVGLLIGGVLKGQEMITNSRLKRIEKDHAGFLAALYTYQDRYLQLPGDDSGAAARFNAYTVGADNANGNGDGSIDGFWDEPSPGTDASTWLTNGSQETVKFFAHLRASGLFTGGPTDTSRPANSFGGTIGIQEGALGVAGQITIFGDIDGPIARILDGRLDNGLGNAGSIQSQLTTESPPTMAVGGTAASNYSDSASYNMAFGL
jgi:prepilin-type N-terminal cleavage/methylation domain-containing protein